MKEILRKLNIYIKYTIEKKIWNIMQVHALNEYEMCALDLRVPNDHNYIFEKGDLFKKFLRNIVDIEKYVAINDSTAIEYWSSDIQKRYYHKVWQILLAGYYRNNWEYIFQNIIAFCLMINNLMLYLGE